MQAIRVTKERATRADVVVNKSSVPKPHANYKWCAVPMDNRSTVWGHTKEEAVTVALELAGRTNGDVLVRA